MRFREMYAIAAEPAAHLTRSESHPGKLNVKPDLHLALAFILVFSRSFFAFFGVFSGDLGL